MIKNTTPYIGKISLKLEKYPEYSGKSKLNKIHLDLGFTKLVSRITPRRDLAGWIVNPECVHKINNYTVTITILWMSNMQNSIPMLSFNFESTSLTLVLGPPHSE